MNCRLALAIFAVFAPAKAVSASGSSGFPGNEAVRVVNGQRVVELPPLTAKAKAFVHAGGKFPPPSGNSEVYMIEAPDALVECSLPYFAPASCAASSLGTVQRFRFWTVKLRGAWVHCASRKEPRKCFPASSGVPTVMAVVE